MVSKINWFCDNFCEGAKIVGGDTLAVKLFFLLKKSILNRSLVQFLNNTEKFIIRVGNDRSSL